MKPPPTGPILLAALIITVGLSLAQSAGAEGPDYPARFSPELNQAALPPEARVYAIIGPRVRPLGWAIDDSWQEAGLVKVVVNSPETPVLLMLAGGQATLWQIGWTEGSRILAVLADGSASQIVTGLPPEVPVMGNDEEGGWYWRTLRWAEEQGRPWPSPDAFRNEMAQKFFGRSIAAESQGGNQQVLLGRPLQAEDHILTLSVPLRETFEVQPSSKPKGWAGLQRGLRLKYIRQAEDADMKAWLGRRAELVRRRTAEAEDLPEHLIPPYKLRDDQELLELLTPPCPNGRPKGSCGWVQTSGVYVLLKPGFSPPEKLPGRPLKFIVPADFPVPAGPVDDKVRLLLMKDGRILSRADYEGEDR